MMMMYIDAPLRDHTVLPAPGRADIPAFIPPAKAGTRSSDPGAMQGWVDL